MGNQRATSEPDARIEARRQDTGGAAHVVHPPLHLGHDTRLIVAGPDATPLLACPGCGERLAAIDGAVHAYVGASSACWTRFAELSTTLPGAGTPLRRLVTDAYMVQHPGVPERRATQSVGVHLVALCLVLERGLPPDALSATLQRVLAQPPAWRWLEPPVPNGPLTMSDLATAASLPPPALHDAINGYVRGVWESWAVHHDVVARWVDACVASR